MAPGFRGESEIFVVPQFFWKNRQKCKKAVATESVGHHQPHYNLDSGPGHYSQIASLLFFLSHLYGMALRHNASISFHRHRDLHDWLRAFLCDCTGHMCTPSCCLGADAETRLVFARHLLYEAVGFRLSAMILNVAVIQPRAASPRIRPKPLMEHNGPHEVTLLQFPNVEGNKETGQSDVADVNSARSLVICQ